MEYQNPILRGSHPDPSICKVNDTYYLVNSSFEFLPGLPVYQSKNLVNWKLISFGIDKNNENSYPYKDLKNSFGIFAPTIRYHEGCFYIICTFVPEGTFIIRTTDPQKGWSKPKWFNMKFSGIDPSLTFLGNDCYLQMTNGKGAIIQCKINPSTCELLTKPQIISYGTGGRDPEGPHVFYQFDKYWLMMAEGGTREGHMETMQVANHIYGPYHSVDNNPILSNRDYKGELQCVGHADLVRTSEKDFELVALAVRQPKHIHRNLLGRETILLPVNWNENNIYVNFANKEGKATIKLPQPIDLEKQSLDLDRIDKTVFMSPFNFESYQVHSRKLILKQNRDKKIKGDFIGFRQKEFNGEFTFSISKEAQSTKKGVVIYKDNYHLFKGLFDFYKNTVTFFKRDSDLIVERNIKFRTKGAKINFSLMFNKERYQIVVSNSKEKAFDSCQTRHFSCEESDSPFTGVVIGLTRNENKECEFKDLSLKYYL